MKKMKIEKKKTYSPPLIEMLEIEMEEGIATGSAKIEPIKDPEGQVSQEWIIGDDKEVDYKW